MTIEDFLGYVNQNEEQIEEKSILDKSIENEEIENKNDETFMQD